MKRSKAGFKPVFLIQALDTLEHLSLRDYIYEEAIRGLKLISYGGQGSFSGVTAECSLSLWRFVQPQAKLNTYRLCM